MTTIIRAAIAATLFTLSLPAFSAEGAKVNPDGQRPSREEMKARWEARCKENPQQCEEMKKKMSERRAYCEANPEKCREEARARMAERFKKADTDGDGALTRAEAEKGMPMVARRFEQLDADKNGKVTPAELEAGAMQRGEGKGRGKGEGHRHGQGQERKPQS